MKIDGSYLQSKAEIICQLHVSCKWQRNPECQERLRGLNIRVDYSTAGGQEAFKIFGSAVGKLIA